MRLSLAAFCLIASTYGVQLRDDDHGLAQADNEFCDGLKYLMNGGTWCTGSADERAKQAVRACSDKEEKETESEKAVAAAIAEKSGKPARDFSKAASEKCPNGNKCCQPGTHIHYYVNGTEPAKK